MKVYGSPSPTVISGRKPSAAGESFAAGDAEETGQAAAAHVGAASSLSSLETLLALQEATGPLERRRRAVRRAGRILDALDELKLAVLDLDGTEGAALHRLAGSVREARLDADDVTLDALLEQVEIRAAVEIAKRETRAAA